MKTYIFSYSRKTRAGYWRDYSKAVKTDNLIQYAKDKLGIMDIFVSAVEVVKSEVCGYRFVEVHGGEYYHNDYKKNAIVCKKQNWEPVYYDYKLKKWWVCGKRNCLEK